MLSDLVRNVQHLLHILDFDDHLAITFLVVIDPPSLRPFVERLDLIERKINRPIRFTARFLQNTCHAHAEILADLLPAHPISR